MADPFAKFLLARLGLSMAEDPNAAVMSPGLAMYQDAAQRQGPRPAVAPRYAPPMTIRPAAPPAPPMSRPIPSMGEASRPISPRPTGPGKQARVVCFEDGSCKQVYPGDPDYPYAQYIPGGGQGGGGKARW